MTKAAKEIFREALELAPGERAELAAELIASLDGEPDTDADAAWAAVIDRRAADAKTGADPGRTWSEVRDQVKARLPLCHDDLPASHHKRSRAAAAAG